MTGGWQDNQGHGGDWQPQQDPYAQPQYGPPYDPYGQYQQDPYQQTYPGWGEPPPPPKKSKLPIVLSIIAIVAVVGGVIAIVLLNRNDDPQPAANTGTSSSNRPATPSKVPPLGTTKKPATSGANPQPKEGWITVELSDCSGCTYQAPGDWKKSDVPKDSNLGVVFKDVTESGTYDCGGKNYFRGFAASSLVQSKSGVPLDVGKVATDFANSFAGKYYSNPKIDVPEPTSTTVAGKKAATVTAKLTVTPGNAECEATGGEVAVLAVATVQDGVQVLVVVNDLAGGPANPKPLPDPLAEEILGTFSVR